MRIREQKMRIKEFKTWPNESLSESCLVMQGEGVSTILRSQELLSLGKDAAHSKSFQ